MKANSSGVLSSIFLGRSFLITHDPLTTEYRATSSIYIITPLSYLPQTLHSNQTRVILKPFVAQVGRRY